MRKVVAFMYPFIKDKSAWPYKHDVEHWDDFPDRQPTLALCRRRLRTNRLHHAVEDAESRPHGAGGHPKLPGSPASAVDGEAGSCGKKG